MAAVCRSVPAVDEASRLNRVRRNAVERGDIANDAAAKAGKGSPLLGAPDLIGPDEITDLFANLSEAISAAANAERDALETLRVAVTGREGA